MWKTILSGIVGLAAIVFGIIKISEFFILPACDSSRVTEAIHSIFESRDVPLEAVDRIEMVSEEEAITCKAHIVTADETGELAYTVSWDGWSAQVRIDAVDAKPRRK